MSSRWELNGWNVELERQIPVDMETDVILPIAGNREIFGEAMQRQGFMREKAPGKARQRTLWDHFTRQDKKRGTASSERR